MLGGDGTLLHLTKLFSATPPPPVISFNMGTLGFLTPFDVKNYRHILRGLLQGTPPPRRSKPLLRLLRSSSIILSWS